MNHLWDTVGLSSIGGLLLVSCSLLENSEQYLSPVAAEVILLDVPTDTLGEYGVNVPAATALMVTVGRLIDPGAASASPFSGEGVEDAVVTVTTPDGVFDLTSDSSAAGVYNLSSLDEPGFKYVEGGEYTINMNFSGENYWIKLVAAQPIELLAPSELGGYQAPGTDLLLSWKNPADNIVVTMFDSNGGQVYDNLPRDLNSVFSFLTEQPSTSYTLPGNLFVDGKVYGIGVAGLARITVDEAHVSTNLNHLVTNAASGTSVVTVVTTQEIPDPDDLIQ